MIISIKALNVEPEVAPADSTAVSPADTTSAE
jgi:hypothetical protein